MDLARLGVGRVGLGLAGSSSSFPGNGEESTPIDLAVFSRDSAAYTTLIE